MRALDHTTVNKPVAKIIRVAPEILFLTVGSILVVGIAYWF